MPDDILMIVAVGDEMPSVRKARVLRYGPLVLVSKDCQHSCGSTLVVGAGAALKPALATKMSIGVPI